MCTSDSEHVRDMRLPGDVPVKRESVSRFQQFRQKIRSKDQPELLMKTSGSSLTSFIVNLARLTSCDELASEHSASTPDPPNRSPRNSDHSMRSDHSSRQSQSLPHSLPLTGVGRSSLAGLLDSRSASPKFSDDGRGPVDKQEARHTVNSTSDPLGAAHVEQNVEAALACSHPRHPGTPGRNETDSATEEAVNSRETNPRDVASIGLTFLGHPVGEGGPGNDDCGQFSTPPTVHAADPTSPRTLHSRIDLYL